MNETATSLLRFWHAGGILMPILAAVSFGIWYLSLNVYIPLLLACRRVKRVIPDCSAIDRQGTQKPTATRASARTDVAPPAGIACDTCPRIDITDYYMRQLRPYEQHLKLLRALVVCAPLLGLLGTVKGMIATFVALGERGAASMDMLSVGISEALITTQVGLFIAIPGLISSHASARLSAQITHGLELLGIHQMMLDNRRARNRLPEAST
jgi:biopolymer transport protein ExbB